MSKTSKIKLLLNSALLIGAVVSLSVIGLWPNQTENIDRLSNIAVKQYEKHYNSLASRTLEELNDGSSTAIRSLLDDWQDVQKMDRLFYIKREMLLSLSKHLYQRQDFEQMLKWTTIWKSLDPRDITARACYFEALRHREGHEEEGFAGLESEWKRFPENKALTHFYFTAGRESNNQRILDLAKQQVVQKIPKKWKIYWDTGTGYSEQKSYFDQIVQNEKDMWQVSFTIPTVTTRIMLVPPSNIVLKLSGINISSPNTPLRRVPKDAIKLLGIVENQDGTHSVGNIRPHLYSLILSPPLDALPHKPTQTSKTISLQLTSIQTPPAGVTSGWQTFWSVDSVFSEESSKTHTILPSSDKTIRLQTTVPGGTSHLRIDPPPHLRLNIFDFSVSLAGRKYEGDLIKNMELSGVTRVKKVLHVEGGEDPRLILSLPKSRNTSLTEPIDIIVTFSAELSDFEK